MTDFLEPFKGRYTPKRSSLPHSVHCSCIRCEDKQVEWQNEGHKGISEDFSDMPTPQEREDSGTIVDNE